MNENPAEVSRKPTLISRIKERFAKLKERSAQIRLGAEMAKDAEAKTNLADKLTQRINGIVATETKHTLGLDAQVEAEWLKAYQKIYNTLGEGKAKQAMEKLTPVMEFHAKAVRTVSHYTDQGLQAFALLCVGNGLKNTINQLINLNENPLASIAFSRRAQRDFLIAGLTGIKPIEHLSIGGAQAQGFVGEKVIRIVNKIMHKPEIPVEKMPSSVT